MLAVPVPIRATRIVNIICAGAVGHIWDRLAQRTKGVTSSQSIRWAILTGEHRGALWNLSGHRGKRGRSAYARALAGQRAERCRWLEHLGAAVPTTRLDRHTADWRFGLGDV
jgi:hypothetical protein